MLRKSAAGGSLKGFRRLGFASLVSLPVLAAYTAFLGPLRMGTFVLLGRMSSFPTALRFHYFDLPLSAWYCGVPEVSGSSVPGNPPLQTLFGL